MTTNRMAEVREAVEIQKIIIAGNYGGINDEVLARTHDTLLSLAHSYLAGEIGDVEQKNKELTAALEMCATSSALVVELTKKLKSKMATPDEIVAEIIKSPLYRTTGNALAGADELWENAHRWATDLAKALVGKVPKQCIHQRSVGICPHCSGVTEIPRRGVE